jgi:hypothetical protein
MEVLIHRDVVSVLGCHVQQVVVMLLFVVVLLSSLGPLRLVLAALNLGDCHQRRRSRHHCVLLLLLLLRLLMSRWSRLDERRLNVCSPL